MIHKFFSATLLSLLLVVVSAQAESKNDLYIVINEATWCKYCKAHGERIHELIDQYALDNRVLVVNNDVTNKDTKKKSLPQLEMLGVKDFMQYRKESAVVFVFNAETSELVDKFSIKLENDKILEHLNEALAAVQG